MSFHRYLQNHYVTACNLQRDIAKDPLIVAMLENRSDDADLVKFWMQGYGLFQGISAQRRTAIVKATSKLLWCVYPSDFGRYSESEVRILSPRPDLDLSFPCSAGCPAEHGNDEELPAND